MKYLLVFDKIKATLKKDFKVPNVNAITLIQFLLNGKHTLKLNLFKILSNISKSAKLF